MSDVFAALGSKMYFSANGPATYDEVGFEALSWSLFAELVGIPAFGPESADITHTPIATGITAHRVGAIDYGSLDMTAAYSAADTGATLLNTEANKAAGVERTISVKVVLANTDTYYFTAQARKAKIHPGETGAISMFEASISIDNAVVKAVTP